MVFNMRLFDYGQCECEMCKRNKCDMKMVLYNVLPANVCDIVGQFIINDKCWRNLFLKQYQVSELLMGYRNIADRRWNREISRIVAKQNVRGKYASNLIKLQAIGSLCKRDRDVINLAIRGCHSKEELNKFFSHLTTKIGSKYCFKGREYSTIDLVKRFLVEYADDRIGDKKRIKEHIDKFFD